MDQNNTIGIVLQVIPFQDYHQIVSLYSPEWGLIKVLFKFSRSGKNSFTPEPLSVIELIFKKGRGDLFQSLNASMMDSNLMLRERYDMLHAALGIAAALIKSQMAQKPSPVLFSLLLHYLNFLPHASSPKVFLASFKLKTLRHDGLIAHWGSCSICQASFLEGGMSQGEFFCSTHLPLEAQTFLAEEMLILKELMFSRSLHTLNTLSLTEALEQKIGNLFTSMTG